MANSPKQLYRVLVFYLFMNYFIFDRFYGNDRMQNVESNYCVFVVIGLTKFSNSSNLSPI